MIFNLSRMGIPKTTKTIEIAIDGDQVVVDGDYTASCSISSIQDRLNGMVLGRHACQPLITFQVGGTKATQVLHIRRGEIFFAEAVEQADGWLATQSYAARCDLTLDGARDFFGAKKLTPFLPEFADLRAEAALRQCLASVNGDGVSLVGSFGAEIQWRHKAYAWRNMRFGRGHIVAPDSEWSTSSIKIELLGGWKKAIQFCSYILSMDAESRPHTQMLTFGPVLQKNWDLLGKDIEFLDNCLSLADSIEV